MECKQTPVDAHGKYFPLRKKQIRFSSLRVITRLTVITENLHNNNKSNFLFVTPLLHDRFF